MMAADQALVSPDAREYHHLLRGPRFSWWRPMLAVALFLPVALLFWLVPALAFVLAGQREVIFAKDDLRPVAFAFTNLTLASFILAAMLITWLVYRVDPRYLSSVAGRIRWRWLLRCAAVIVPMYVVYLALDLLLDWPQTAPPAQQGWLLLIILTMTPLQAAGEEYVARGLLTQNIGAWFSNSRLALVVTALVSTAFFTAAHGSADMWIVLDLAVGSIGCSLLVWKTGGLEAAIVLHAANNVMGMASSLIFGGWGEGFIDAESKGEPLDVLLTLLVTGTVVVLVLSQARRCGLQHVYRPEPGEADVVGSRPAVAAGTVVLGSIVAIVAAIAVVAIVLPERKPRRLPILHYAEVIASVGVSADGCLRGYVVDALPIEIRHYRSRQLVGDEVVIQLDGHVLTGHGGTFQLPISAALMAANPRFRVLQPDGSSIDYMYRFASVSVQAQRACDVASPAVETP
jgi:membrane protease YdiL (CAAX protease family)